MKLKQCARYQIDFWGKWVVASGGLMGLSVFLRFLHYFGIHMIRDFQAGEIVWNLAIPAVITVTFVLLIGGIRWNAPGVYGILGALLCLLLIIWNFSSGNVLRIVFSVIWYLGSGFVLLATVGGYMTTRFLCFLCFLVPFCFRIALFDIPLPGFNTLFAEGSDLCIIASLSLFPLVLVPGKRKTDMEHDTERKR